MENTRKCPKCSRILQYKNKYLYNVAVKAGKTCKSCSIKKLYKQDPDKNKGERNGRSGIKTIDVFINKYGPIDGEKKYKELLEKLALHGFKNGTENVSYGKIRNNSGWSYKGWYKNMFFRSSLELLFILNFEKLHNRLPLSAEKLFHIKYGDKTYTPDFYDDELKTIYEIKVGVFLNENLEKFTAARKYVETTGLHFVVVTDKDLNYSERGVIKLLDTMTKEGTVLLTDKTVSKLNTRLSKDMK